MTVERNPHLSWQRSGIPQPGPDPVADAVRVHRDLMRSVPLPDPFQTELERRRHPHEQRLGWRSEGQEIVQDLRRRSGRLDAEVLALAQLLGDRGVHPRDPFRDHRLAPRGAALRVVGHPTRLDVTEAHAELALQLARTEQEQQKARQAWQKIQELKQEQP